ncbi:DUF1799 domain-containing protein [Chachezhania antarctica]|uniref:DUF1799 domain-containing protein n=1 Tax=Chachezhania antarctica TaxID=2340860 RepID=UPI001968B6CD|nr:DUF1799 domain-containing protein [Chachezhania antarctica]
MAIELWADHLKALELFLTISTQWRVVGGFGGVATIGLDYSAAEAGLRLEDKIPAPSVWSDIRMIERGALEVLNEDKA